MALYCRFTKPVALGQATSQTEVDILAGQEPVFATND